MSYHFRRILTAVAIFFIAMLGYESWRKHQPGYGFFDLLGAKPEGLAMAGSSKLSENDVPNLAKFSEESMKLAAAVLPSVVSIDTDQFNPVQIQNSPGQVDRRYRRA